MIDTTTITMIETRREGRADSYRAFVEGEDYEWYIKYIEGHGRTAHITTRKVGDCYCGSNVELSEFTNECEECGRLFNMAGQDLKPANQWEEVIDGDEEGER